MSSVTDNPTFIIMSSLRIRNSSLILIFRWRSLIIPTNLNLMMREIK